MRCKGISEWIFATKNAQNSKPFFPAVSSILYLCQVAELGEYNAVGCKRGLLAFPTWERAPSSTPCAIPGRPCSAVMGRLRRSPPKSWGATNSPSFSIYFHRGIHGSSWIKDDQSERDQSVLCVNGFRGHLWLYAGARMPRHQHGARSPNAG